jgi:hypothetical protein
MTRARKWPFRSNLRALVFTVPAALLLPVCEQNNGGPGDAPPPGDCDVSAFLATVPPPVAPQCPIDPAAPKPDPCACLDSIGVLPPDVFLPQPGEKGCHSGGLPELGIFYAHEDCARIAEASGRITHYNPGDAAGDSDATMDLCPTRMSPDPFTHAQELRTQGSFVSQSTLGRLHLEVQDCRWYDGTYTFDPGTLTENGGFVTPAPATG